MPTLADVAAMLQQQPYAVVSTLRPSGTIQSTLVNVGLYEDGVGFTTVGRSRKEYHLKRHPACTVTIHHGPYWITVEGQARLRTWDDTDPETMRRVLREIYVAAGGTHDNWDTYDQVMRAERRAAVVVVPERIYVRQPRS
jgi:PPOX class probable F420-dependent enzyme